MDRSALLYYQSAQALKFSTSILPHIAGFEIKLGKRRYFFRGGDTPFNCGSSLTIARNKFCTNQLLEASGFPVPKADVFGKNTFEQHPIETLIDGLNFPLVVKPTKDTASGVDVLCNISDIVQLKAYMKHCYQRHEFLSVEEYHPNLNSYRVLIFYNKVIGVLQRFPAHVTGDGIHTIDELITINNIERELLNQTVTLGPIKIDEEYNIRAKELNITLKTIPRAEETIVLCYTCNSARGGTMHSLGKSICAENARLLCQAAKVLDLNIVGFDVICEDILIPIKQTRGVIIEANDNPDISIHEHPVTGIQTRVSKKIIRRLILRHPISYLLGRCQNKYYGFYLKLSVIMFVVLTGKLLSL